METLARNKSQYFPTRPVLLTPVSLMFIANIQIGKLFFPCLLRDTESKSFPSLQWLQRHCNYSQSHAALTFTVRPLYIRISLRCEFIKHQMTRSIYIFPEAKRRPIWIPKVCFCVGVCVCALNCRTPTVFWISNIRGCIFSVFSGCRARRPVARRLRAVPSNQPHIIEAIRRYSHKIARSSPSQYVITEP